MASKSSELKNLSSRDLPTRRKAVRWLLEHEMQDSLPQFVKFIDDDDVWFREKAKYVFKKWCSDDFLDLVYELLSEKSRKYDYFISTLLFNFSKNIDGIVVKLLTSENIQVRKNTRNFQLSRAGCDNLKPLLFEALNDSDYRVRIVAVNFIDSVTLTDELINKIINDNHSKVKLTALNRLNLIDHSKWIEKFEEIKDKNIMYDLNLLKSEILLKNPKKTLSRWCASIDLDFDNSMLSWNKGNHSQDGIWWKHWYDNVITTTHFQKFSSIQSNLDKKYQSIYDEALDYYNKLYYFAEE